MPPLHSPAPAHNHGIREHACVMGCRICRCWTRAAANPHSCWMLRIEGKRKELKGERERERNSLVVVYRRQRSISSSCSPVASLLFLLLLPAAKGWRIVINTLSLRKGRKEGRKEGRKRRGKREILKERKRERERTKSLVNYKPYNIKRIQSSHFITFYLFHSAFFSSHSGGSTWSTKLLAPVA